METSNNDIDLKVTVSWQPIRPFLRSERRGCTKHQVKSWTTGTFRLPPCIAIVLMASCWRWRYGTGSDSDVDLSATMGWHGTSLLEAFLRSLMGTSSFWGWSITLYARQFFSSQTFRVFKIYHFSPNTNSSWSSVRTLLLGRKQIMILYFLPASNKDADNAGTSAVTLLKDNPEYTALLLRVWSTATL